MAKILLTDLGSLTNEQTSLTTLAANNTALRVAIEKTLSRDGTAPNTMSATLDMNSNRIINLPSPISPTDPVRLGDVNLSTVIVTKEVSFATKALAVASSPGLSVDILSTLGYATPGDGGSAKYARIAPSTAAPYRIQTADGQWWALIEQYAKPEMFGGIPVALGAAAGSVPDCTSAVQAAINWRALKGGKVYFSGGVYGCGGVTIPNTGTYLQGAGTYATIILHTMTAPSTCVFFSAGAAILPNCGISDLSICSQDIVFNKIAVNISDVSVFESKNVHIGCYPLDGSNGNMYRGAAGIGTGFYIGGREHVVLENASVYANIPLELGPNINFAAISADSFFFKNCFFYTTFATNSPVLFDNGVNIFNVHFDGGNWIGGKDGLHWVDGSSTIDSDGLYIRGIKLEQAVDTTGYFVNIQHNTALKNLHVEDCIGGDRRGVRLRKTPHAKLVKYSHQQSAFEAINLDSTAETFEWNNCFFWNGSSITTTGLNRAWAQAVATSTDGSTTIPTSAFYSATTNPVLVQNITADLNVGANTYNNVRITSPASTSTITIGSGKTATVSNTLTFAGTDGTVMTFPTTTAVIARTDTSQTFTNNQTFSATIIGSISGNAATATTATNTTNVNITDDTTTNATFYPTFSPAATGNNGLKVTSSKLGYNPSTGQLNANIFAGAGTGLTGTAASLTAGSTTTNANLTGPITSVGNATSIASQTGTGTKFVVDTTPTLVTPILGVATATSINGVTLDNTAWTTYTPTISSTGGTLASTGTTVTNIAGRYKQIGKVVYVQITGTVSVVGTASGTFFATLPITATSAASFAGASVETSITGRGGGASVNSGTPTLISARQADTTTYWTLNYVVVLTATYEAA